MNANAITMFESTLYFDVTNKDVELKKSADSDADGQVP